MKGLDHYEHSAPFVPFLRTIGCKKEPRAKRIIDESSWNWLRPWTAKNIRRHLSWWSLELIAMELDIQKKWEPYKADVGPTTIQWRRCRGYYLDYLTRLVQTQQWPRRKHVRPLLLNYYEQLGPFVEQILDFALIIVP